MTWIYGLAVVGGVAIVAVIVVVAMIIKQVERDGWNR